MGWKFQGNVISGQNEKELEYILKSDSPLNYYLISMYFQICVFIITQNTVNEHFG